jgi:hypothetical protein
MKCDLLLGTLARVVGLPLKNGVLRLSNTSASLKAELPEPARYEKRHGIARSALVGDVAA